MRRTLVFRSDSTSGSGGEPRQGKPWLGSLSRFRFTLEIYSARIALIQREILIGTIIVSAIVLVVSVLVQQKDGGLGASFGSTGGSYMKKRGAEKFVFFSTIASAIVFCGTILLTFVLK